MNSTITILIAVLSSGAVAAIVSAAMQKRNERESRLFIAKLEAYKEFAAHLESRFLTLVKDEKLLDIGTLGEVSAKCLLVSNATLNTELKTFLAYVADLYEQCAKPNFDVAKEHHRFDKLFADADKIEQLMRADLGFK